MLFVHYVKSQWYGIRGNNPNLATRICPIIALRLMQPPVAEYEQSLQGGVQLQELSF